MRHNFTDEPAQKYSDNASILEDIRQIQQGVDVAPDAERNASYGSYNNSSSVDIISSPKVLYRPIELTPPQIVRFWSHVDRRSIDECWLWSSSKAYANQARTIFYGVYLTFKAHRVAYTLAYGPIPEGLTVDHVKARGCTSTLCCNPAHLEAITQTEQIIRRDGEKSFTRVTLCKWGHIKPVGRKARCKECGKRFAKETLARRRAEDPEAVRAKQAAKRRRQRAAAKARKQQDIASGSADAGGGR